MSYTILETHLVFQKNQLIECAVLWDDNGYVRATYSDLTRKAGYNNLTTKSIISPDLFQEVAGYGTYLDDARKKKYFPGKRNWSR